MSRLFAFLTAFLLTLSFTSGPLHAGEYGDLTGQFVLDGDPASFENPPLVAKGEPTAKDAAVCAANPVPDETYVIGKESKGIANVFVYLRKAPDDIHPDLKENKEKIVFDQAGCVFSPHALVAQAGQPVQVISSDGCAHNVRSQFFRNTSFNFIVQPNDKDGQTVELQSAEPVPSKISCDIHPYMLAFWLPVDHPYAAVTDADGKFEIKGLPAGQHTFRVWHEGPGYIERSLKIEIKAGETTDLGAVEVAEKDLK